MDITHRLVAIFCEIDDFCKELDNICKHKLLANYELKNRLLSKPKITANIT